MSNCDPSGGDSSTAANEVEVPPPPPVGPLKLPDLLPDGANPFRVIDWILFIADVAAGHLRDVRTARVAQLGRLMRTEERGGALMIHWQDDADSHGVLRQLNHIGCPWGAAQRDARKLCAGYAIPFTECDPILKAAWANLEEFWAEIQGAARDEFARPDRALGRRLHELADSTTPAIAPVVNSHIRPATEEAEGDKPPAAARGEGHQLSPEDGIEDKGIDRAAKERAALAELLLIGPNASRIAEQVGVKRTTLLGWPMFRVH